MRVTNNMLVGNLLYNLNQNLGRLDKINEQISSKKKFSVPSDDPIGASKSLKLRTDISKIQQYKRNAEDAESWMRETESALIEIGSVLHRANELAVQMANETYSDEDLEKVKAEVEQLKKHLIEIGNTTYAGRHIFTGYKTDKKLLDEDGNYKLVDENSNGSSQLTANEIVEYNIGVSETVKVNTVGIKVFGVDTEDDKINPFEKTKVDTNDTSYLISVFEQFEAALGDNKGEIDKTIGRLQTCMDQTLSVRAEIGAKMRRLELTKDKLDSQVLSTTELLSKNEDTDLAKASIDLKAEENVYRASLAVGMNIIQPSLVDFLR
ncbi:flagellar hook-associated protein FlgL [Anaerosalibacter bizertensis]|uniref:Flagellar hook-associated protein FlgL n=1 Tax=Anaerosalibacter bizertensis TaxID=932217 RepID=A0A9Q4ACF2_9FIRM|nr:flagellar hook-associated protein FlgL [Anaerosalibacter bizertensis]MBV1817495.1 flagellar hook-associated protein FlgL [Bacteroidales bacterium MSK.15.36]MCB5559084.1 flagellar hook-associated protein FlgL [Anaerosalibacter bizertensis]MCG4564797.1 flagellar hook-associated protein FlgL [Anaerosalibacter bizertensis]MCG4582535.1 flagellar hook-associated protein FlgL [Anaerosalibacter bizertensis]MCG4584838.1 flagellar hook-associated protein FlgL [Anaerosalibacter bizertensis]